MTGWVAHETNCFYDNACVGSQPMDHTHVIWVRNGRRYQNQRFLGMKRGDDVREKQEKGKNAKWEMRLGKKFHFWQLSMTCPLLLNYATMTTSGNLSRALSDPPTDPMSLGSRLVPKLFTRPFSTYLGDSNVGSLAAIIWGAVTEWMR